MKNGKPILNAESEYHGDKDMYATFRDRDPRMYHTIMPPYKVKAGGGTYRTCRIPTMRPTVSILISWEQIPVAAIRVSA